VTAVVQLLLVLGGYIGGYLIVTLVALCNGNLAKTELWPKL